MHFDTSISLGNVIALCILLFTFHKYHMSNVKRFLGLEFKVKLMWQSLRVRLNMPNIPEIHSDDGELNDLSE